MKKINLYVIYDAVADCPVSAIIPCVNDGIAIRGFISFIKNEDIKDKAPTEDLRLYRICSLDEDYNLVNNGYNKKMLVTSGVTCENDYEVIKESLIDKE